MANVNVPTDVKQKEKDVNAKLQLYGIYSAFANGKVPSNKQIDVALNSALASKALKSPSKKLSSEGQELVADLQEVIKQAKYLLLTKNQGNLIQDFIWEAQNIDGANASLPGAPVSKETSQQHGQQALDGLKTLGTLILSNGQFRKLLSDASVLLRDMAGDAAQKAANKVNPSEDQLKNIDEPAQDNTWHDVPDLSVGNIKAQAKQTVDKNKPFSREEAKDVANESADKARNQPTNEDAGAAGAQHAAQNLKEKARQNIPDETQEKAQNMKDGAVASTKDYVDKKMPKERRDQTVYRLKKMIVEIQDHPDYNQAIDTLLNLAETYTGHGKELANQTAGTVKDAHADDALKNAEADLLALVERFANSTSTDDLWESFNNVYQDSQRDPELKKWFSDLNRYIRRLLKETGYVLDDASNQEGNRLYDQGNFLLRERYRDHTNRVLDEVKFLASQFEKDPQNKAFGDAMDKLFNHLGNDQNGKPTFKPDLVKDLANVIIPGIFENVRYVPIPRIEISDPQVDAIIENLVIEGDNLLPNSFEVTSDNHFKWGRKGLDTLNRNKFEVAVSHIQMDLRDVSYYIKKKEGFPSITDKGIFDLFFGGSGLSFRFGLQTADKTDKHHLFKVSNVKVDLANLKIKLKKSNHKLLFNIFKPTLMGVVKPVVLKAIEKQIRSSIEKLDAYAYDIKKEADRALEAAKNDPENVPNLYQRYVNAIQAKVAEGKRKADKAGDRAKQTQANVAMTKNDSIFKNISLPGGISTKATEYQEMAKQGDKWESPVFALGNAAKSTNIPKPAPITRKPHSVTQGQLRDASAAGASGSTFDNNLSSHNNISNYMSNGNGIKTSQNDAPILTGQSVQ